MSYTFEEFAKLTDAQLREISGGTKCTDCGTLLNRDVTGLHKVASGFLCSDCFYTQIGKFIDKHPIGLPRPRGRG